MTPGAGADGIKLVGILLSSDGCGAVAMPFAAAPVGVLALLLWCWSVGAVGLGLGLGRGVEGWVLLGPLLPPTRLFSSFLRLRISAPSSSNRLSPDSFQPSKALGTRSLSPWT